jgi:hypothetical protein
MQSDTLFAIRIAVTPAEGSEPHEEHPEPRSTHG